MTVSPVDAAARAEQLRKMADRHDAAQPWKVGAVLRENATVIDALASLLAVREAELQRKTEALLTLALFSLTPTTMNGVVRAALEGAAVPDGPDAPLTDEDLRRATDDMPEKVPDGPVSE